MTSPQDVPRPAARASEPVATASPVGTPAAATYATVQHSDEFKDLRRRFRNFVWPATVVFLSWYLLYVILSGWARGFMGVDLIGNINVAYVFGLLQFVSTFLIAWLYARYADRNLDPRSQQIAEEFQLSQEVPR